MLRFISFLSITRQDYYCKEAYILIFITNFVNISLLKDSASLSQTVSREPCAKPMLKNYFNLAKFKLIYFNFGQLAMRNIVCLQHAMRYGSIINWSPQPMQLSSQYRHSQHLQLNNRTNHTHTAKHTHSTHILHHCLVCHAWYFSRLALQFKIHLSCPVSCILGPVLHWSLTTFVLYVPFSHAVGSTIFHRHLVPIPSFVVSTPSSFSYTQSNYFQNSFRLNLSQPLSQNWRTLSSKLSKNPLPQSPRQSVCSRQFCLVYGRPHDHPNVIGTSTITALVIVFTVIAMNDLYHHTSPISNSFLSCQNWLVSTPLL